MIVHEFLLNRHHRPKRKEHHRLHHHCRKDTLQSFLQQFPLNDCGAALSNKSGEACRLLSKCQRQVQIDGFLTILGILLGIVSFSINAATHTPLGFLFDCATTWTCFWFLGFLAAFIIPRLGLKLGTMKRLLELVPYIQVTVTVCIFQWQIKSITGVTKRSAAFIEYLIRWITCLAVALLAQRFLMQRITVHFQHKAHGKQIEDTDFLTQTLAIISETLSNDNDRNFESLPIPLQPIVHFKDVKSDDGTSHVHDMPYNANTESAIADRMFDSLTSHRRVMTPACSTNDLCVEEDDLATFLRCPTKAKRLLSLLDIDGNGSVSRDELRVAMGRISRDRHLLSLALSSTNTFLGKLDSLTAALAVILGSLYFMAHTTTVVWSSFTKWATILLGYKVIFEGTINALITSIIHVLLVHPYDIGDWVTMEGGGGGGSSIADDSYLVIDIELWYTVLHHGQRGLLYVPNWKLAESGIIGNLKRSELLTDYLSLRLSIATTMATSSAMAELQNKIKKAMSNNARHFKIPTILPLQSNNLLSNHGGPLLLEFALIRNIVLESDQVVTCQLQIPLINSCFTAGSDSQFWARRRMVHEAVRRAVEEMKDKVWWAEGPQWEFARVLESGATPQILVA